MTEATLHTHHITQKLHFWIQVWKKNENSNLKRYMHPDVHRNPINDSQDMEATQVPTDR